jgi:hypothetical protein
MEARICFIYFLLIVLVQQATSALYDVNITVTSDTIPDLPGRSTVYLQVWAETSYQILNCTGAFYNIRSRFWQPQSLFYSQGSSWLPQPFSTVKLVYLETEDDCFTHPITSTNICGKGSGSQASWYAVIPPKKTIFFPGDPQIDTAVLVGLTSIEPTNTISGNINVDIGCYERARKRIFTSTTVLTPKIFGSKVM